MAHWTMTDQQRKSLSTLVKLLRASESVSSYIHRNLGTYKLTISQFGVLEALYNIGPLCQKELGKKILKTSGNITMVIDNLSKRGLVIRTQDPNDRRFITVTLTPEGRELISNIFPEHVTYTGEAFEHLSDTEMEALGVLLKKLGRDGKYSKFSE